MAATAQNLEDAANLASEFIYSLDHLPNEVRHYLDELRHKDARVQELQQQIDTDSARWIRHTLRGTNSAQGSSPSSSPAPSSKANIPSKIDQSYAEIEKLSNEKVALAERIAALITRTRNRLDYDLNKVRMLQGELPLNDSISARGVSATPSLTAAALVANSSLTGHDPAGSLSESLRLALSPNVSAPVAMDGRRANAANASAAPATKRLGRRATASPSIKLPPAGSRSISPASAPTKAAQSRSSRLSRQIHPPVEDVDMGDDADADADEDMPGDEDEDGEDVDDDKLYCFCQRSSYGDMIACDNEGACPYEWFHLSCVGLTKPLPDKWYCSVCEVKVVAVASVNVGRKGRKKTS